MDFLDFFTLEFWKSLWTDTVEFISELPAWILSEILDALASLLESLNPPQFMDQSIGVVLGPTGPYIGYFLNQSGFAEAFAILGLGLAFRLTRKLVTLGQW